jgi:DNA invertase Pin-like site-specific DNA recombinase
MLGHKKQLKVAIYSRVSTNEQSIENQLKSCREYVERNQYVVYKEYHDVYSGIKDSRPGFNELLNDMRKYKFDAILVTKLDRLGRSLKHLMNLIEEFTKRGIHFITVDQHIDTTSTSGIFQLQIMGAFAEFERNLISERTKEGLKGKLNVGKRGSDKKPRKKRAGIKKQLVFINKGLI